MEVTSRVRGYIYREFLENNAQVPHVSASGSVDGARETEAASRNNALPSVETQAGNGPVVSTPQSSSTAAASQRVKVDSSFSYDPRIFVVITQERIINYICSSH